MLTMHVESISILLCGTNNLQEPFLRNNTMVPNVDRVIIIGNSNTNR